MPNIPSSWRAVIYWVVLVGTVVLGVLGGFGLVPPEAVARGAEIVLTIVTVVGAALALLYRTPDA